ncbi:glutathione peroxidase [Nostoc sp. PA-18-2419]|uniref:glutathione peroxidase n=1 Tax=Nostoc sp. PA-18-2419 TaxID=2575443 RepID=UPI0011087857|nr:glutathione peroxidase [Nostoc sp. PA-18-2419]
MSNTIFDIVVKTINDQDKQLNDHAQKVLLIVNLASYSGYTSQNAGLEKLNQKYKEAGLSVLGFPCKDFGQQEPTSNQEIVKFFTSQFNVTSKLSGKVDATGSQQQPVDDRLSEAVEPTRTVRWNFDKFLVNQQGQVVARFNSSVHPSSLELITTIESEQISKLVNSH